jgi:hypothetical protein
MRFSSLRGRMRSAHLHMLSLWNAFGLALAMATWSVDIIRHRAEHLGVVEAATEKEAIKAAIKEFQIEPARQNRVTVRKID